MKRKRVSTIFPLRKSSKDSFEVLRLGLERTNPRISITPLVATQINAGIEALLADSGKAGKRRKEDDHAQIRELFPPH